MSLIADALKTAQRQKQQRESGKSHSVSPLLVQLQTGEKQGFTWRNALVMGLSIVVTIASIVVMVQRMRPKPALPSLPPVPSPLAGTPLLSERAKKNESLRAAARALTYPEAPALSGRTVTRVRDRTTDSDAAIVPTARTPLPQTVSPTVAQASAPVAPIRDPVTSSAASPALPQGDVKVDPTRPRAQFSELASDSVSSRARIVEARPPTREPLSQPRAQTHEPSPRPSSPQPQPPQTQPSVGAPQVSQASAAPRVQSVTGDIQRPARESQPPGREPPRATRESQSPTREPQSSGPESQPPGRETQPPAREPQSPTRGPQPSARDAQPPGRLRVALEQSNNSDAARLFAEALAAHRAGQLATARPLYERVLALSPNDADALNNLGVLLSALREYDRALELLRHATVVAPSNAGTWNNIGAVLREQGHGDEASAAFQRALMIDPQHQGAKVGLAQQYLATGLPAQARALLEDVLRTNPGLAEAHYTLGQTLELQGDRAGAIREFSAFVRFAPPRLAEHVDRVRRHVDTLSATP